MNPKFVLGADSYREVIESGIFYIDKTPFIREWWERGDKVTLITRPRRFGKTLNMSMLDCFFSNLYAGRGDLFEGLEIWKDEKYRALQGTVPVISLSFGGVKNTIFIRYEHDTLYAGTGASPTGASQGILQSSFELQTDVAEDRG